MSNSRSSAERRALGKLADALVAEGYMDLFMRLDTGRMDRLWSRPSAPQRLSRLAGEARFPWEPRFLAAEILFRKDEALLRRLERAGLAGVYAEALRHATMANPWGSPGQLDGEAGRHLVSLGEAAAAALQPLLDDPRRIPYFGSQDATWGNSFSFRVKDFAAFFIRRIRAWPYELHVDTAIRDADIRQLIDKMAATSGGAP